jgi:hypothetical protein
MSRQEPVQRIGKGAAVILAKRRWSTRELTAISHLFHEVAHGQPLLNIIFGVKFPSGIQRMAVFLDHCRGQRDIRGDDQITEPHPFGDVVVSRVDTTRHLDGSDRARGRDSQGLIGDQIKPTGHSFRGAKQNLFDDVRAGIGIDPDLH